MPVFSRRSSRRCTGRELRGALGVQHGDGVRSNVTATVGRSTRPGPRSWVSTAGGPGNPVEVAHGETTGRSSSGVAAGSVKRCTLDTLRTRRGEDDVAAGRGAGLVEQRDQGAVGGERSDRFGASRPQ